MDKSEDAHVKQKPHYLILIGIGLLLAMYASIPIAEESVVRTGSYLRDRGPYDPRPFDKVRAVESFILGANF